jgi:hypothetical protein
MREFQWASVSERWQRRVGDGISFSATHNFTTLPAVGSSDVLKIAVTADMGKLAVQIDAKTARWGSLQSGALVGCTNVASTKPAS